MIEPTDAILAFHNAFRRDMAAIDASALAWGRGLTGEEATLHRFRFFNDVLVWHATGEEIAIFPALEQVAPLTTEPYIRDHRGLDAAYDVLSDAVAEHDPLATARATAAFKFHLDLHLAKEDAHVYRLIKERVSVEDRAKALGTMVGVTPPDRFPEVIAWIYPLLGDIDRERMTRVWQSLMPPETFRHVTPLIRDAVGDGWTSLAQRIPELAE